MHYILFLTNTPTIQKNYASHKLRTLRFSLVFSEINNAFHTSKFHCKIQCTVKPASWHQAQENINERCNLPQLNVLFTEGKTHIPWAQNCGHKFGSRATNFSIVAQFLGPESGPCFGAHKTQTGAIQYWQQVCYCRRKLTAAHIRDTVIIHIPDLNQSKPQMLNDQKPRPASIRRSLGVGMWMTKEGIQRMTMGGRLKMTWTNRNQPWWLLKMDPWNPWQISQRSRVVPNALANHQIPSGI